jgi:hypothetical protein
VLREAAGATVLAVFASPALRAAHGFLLPDHLLAGLRQPATLWLCEHPTGSQAAGVPVVGLALRTPLPQPPGQPPGQPDGPGMTPLA